MSKNNEIVACKASGISLYRLAVPLLFAGLALAASMIVLDETYLPYANQRQDALRNQIKGRPAQTYAHPQRWIFGNEEKIYNYDLFDPTQNLFGGLSDAAPDLCHARDMVRFAKSLGSRGRMGARFRRWHHCPL
jgi:lipopolysaccharide export LptBFGC system permease protein LptF